MRRAVRSGRQEAQRRPRRWCAAKGAWVPRAVGAAGQDEFSRWPSAFDDDLPPRSLKPRLVSVARATPDGLEMMSELQKGKVNGGSHTLDHVPTVDCAIRRSRTTAHARGLRERRGPPSPRAVPSSPYPCSTCSRQQPRELQGHPQSAAAAAAVKASPVKNASVQVSATRVARSCTTQRRPVGSHRVAGARHQVNSSPIGYRRRLPRSYWRDPLRHLPGHVAK